MDITEIIGDAIAYPLHNVKALVLYMLIGIIAGILGAGSLIAMIPQASNNHIIAAGGLGFIGILVIIIGALLISGYGLDIVKFGIERRDDAPGIDLVRQVSNAIKVLIVGLVYYIVPAVIAWLLLTLLGKGILTLIVVLVLYIVFAFAEFMAVCRLAKYDSLGAALSIGDAISDISEVGMLKVLITIIAVFVICLLVAFIFMVVYAYHNIIGGILLGILGVYATFFYNRAIGLLYSDVN